MSIHPMIGKTGQSKPRCPKCGNRMRGTIGGRSWKCLECGAKLLFRGEVQCR